MLTYFLKQFFSYQLLNPRCCCSAWLVSLVTRLTIPLSRYRECSLTKKLALLEFNYHESAALIAGVQVHNYAQDLAVSKKTIQTLTP